MPALMCPVTVPELLTAIERRHGFGLRAFARRLGVSATSIMAWRDRRSVPSDSHGLTLAALADLDPVGVLICLQLARTDCPEGRAAWRQVLTEHLHVNSES